MDKHSIFSNGQVKCNSTNRRHNIIIDSNRESPTNFHIVIEIKKCAARPSVDRKK